MISITTSGSTDRTRKFLDTVSKPDFFASGVEALAQRGVEALRASTPAETGLTAASWYYEIKTEDGKTTISWCNGNRVNGVNIAIILQYGHGTGTGGYVAGRDYINPALKPIFDEIADGLWKKVTQA